MMKAYLQSRRFNTIPLKDRAVCLAYSMQVSDCRDPMYQKLVNNRLQLFRQPADS